MQPFIEITSGGQLVGLGLALVMAALYLHRRSVRRRPSSKRDPLQQMQAELKRIESSPAAQITKMEVRLHDFAREVEGRINTRLALLDRLILDADREIGQLEQLIMESREIRLSIPADSSIADDSLPFNDRRLDHPRDRDAEAA